MKTILKIQSTPNPIIFIDKRIKAKTRTKKYCYYTNEYHHIHTPWKNEIVHEDYDDKDED